MAGTSELIKYYRARCLKNERECEQLGSFEFESEMWLDAIKDLGPYCEADHDGDMGYSCYKKAFALEKLEKKTEALEFYTKSCKKRQNNEACAAAYKIKGKKSKNIWVGLYRNRTGTIFVELLNDTKISINADTNWANGHYCGWNKVGTITDDKMNIEADTDAPDCKPVIQRVGTKIKIEDLNSACKLAYCGARALFEGEFELDSKSNPN